MNPDEKLTPNFKFKEFFCCGIEPPEKYFNNIMACAYNLQKVRDIIGLPIIITSAFRTREHNSVFRMLDISMIMCHF